MTFTPATWPRKLRSQEWFGGTSKDAIYHRSWMKNQGFPADVFDGRPVIGICNTWSELTPCNAHLRDLAERVKNGVWEAGGFPVEFPVFSPSEVSLRPTAMMFRNVTQNFMDYGVELCETNPELEDNLAVQASWKDFDPILHKRRRTYRKDLV